MRVNNNQITNLISQKIVAIEKFSPEASAITDPTADSTGQGPNTAEESDAEFSDENALEVNLSETEQNSPSPQIQEENFEVKTQNIY